jgi:hypothetical protein
MLVMYAPLRPDTGSRDTSACHTLSAGRFGQPRSPGPEAAGRAARLGDAAALGTAGADPDATGALPAGPAAGGAAAGCEPHPAIASTRHPATGTDHPRRLSFTGTP